MFWTIVAALLFVFVGLPIIFWFLAWLPFGLMDALHKSPVQPVVRQK